MDRTQGHRQRRRPARDRVGCLVAAVVNLIVLWIAHQLLAWGWPSFLTSSFDQLLPVIDLSLVATVVVNLLWVVWQPAWFRHLAQAALDVIGVAVAVRTWQVFPFDLSAGWETTFRVVLVLAVVGTAIAAVVELVRFGGSITVHPGRSAADHRRPRHA